MNQLEILPTAHIRQPTVNYPMKLDLDGKLHPACRPATLLPFLFTKNKNRSVVVVDVLGPP